MNEQIVMVSEQFIETSHSLKPVDGELEWSLPVDREGDFN